MKGEGPTNEYFEQNIDNYESEEEKDEVKKDRYLKYWNCNIAFFFNSVGDY